MQGGREAGLVPEDPDLFVEGLCEELHHVLEIPVSRDQNELLELVRESYLHGLHYYGDVHLLLYLDLKSLLIELTSLIGAPGLLLLESPDIDANRILLQTVVQSALSEHDALSIPLGRHKVPLSEREAPCLLSKKVN